MRLLSDSSGCKWCWIQIEEQSVLATAAPLDALTETDQVTDQVKRLLGQLQKGEGVTAPKLMRRLKLKHRPTFRANYMQPALEAGLIEMTQPNSPNSPTQRYRLPTQSSK